MVGTLSHRHEAATSAVLWPAWTLAKTVDARLGVEGGAGRGSGSTEKYATQCCTLAKLHFQFVSGQAQRRKQGTSKWPTRREKKIYIKEK